MNTSFYENDIRPWSPFMSATYALLLDGLFDKSLDILPGSNAGTLPNTALKHASTLIDQLPYGCLKDVAAYSMEYSAFYKDGTRPFYELLRDGRICDDFLGIAPVQAALAEAISEVLSEMDLKSPDGDSIAHAFIAGEKIQKILIKLVSPMKSVEESGRLDFFLVRLINKVNDALLMQTLTEETDLRETVNMMSAFTETGDGESIDVKFAEMFLPIGFAEPLQTNIIFCAVYPFLMSVYGRRGMRVEDFFRKYNPFEVVNLLNYESIRSVSAQLKCSYKEISTNAVHDILAESPDKIIPVIRMGGSNAQYVSSLIQSNADALTERIMRKVRAATKVTC